MPNITFMKRTTSNTLLIVLTVLMGIFGISCNDNHQISKKPNIVFYLADDQDVYDYGCYGNDKVKTPAVDRLAKEGMRFTLAFTGQAICAPSRSQLYTGKYPLKNGCFLNHIQVKENQASVTNYMRDLGYEVILAGKSHVGPKKVFDWDKEWKPVEKQGVPRPYLPLDSVKSFFQSADAPFCIFLTSDYPHGPYFDVDDASKEDIKYYPFNEEKQSDASIVNRLAGYYKNIEEDNKQLEKILRWVDEYLDENTIFIYSADHGRSGKFTVYDRGLHVPFVVRWPGVVKANSISDVMIHYTDVLPTFIEIAGGKTPDDLDGKSFLAALRGDQHEIHEFVYGVQTNQNIQRAAVFPSRSIRSKQFKYIRNFNSMEVVDQNLGENEYVNAFIKIGARKFKDRPFEELYDIVNDPFEQRNLADDVQYQEIKKTLVDSMFQWMKQQGDILVKENYMPILEPIHHRLDETSKWKTVPDSLEKTLTRDDYLILHY